MEWTGARIDGAASGAAAEASFTPIAEKARPPRLPRLVLPPSAAGSSSSASSSQLQPPATSPPRAAIVKALQLAFPEELGDTKYPDAPWRRSQVLPRQPSEPPPKHILQLHGLLPQGPGVIKQAKKEEDIQEEQLHSPISEGEQVDSPIKEEPVGSPVSSASQSSDEIAVCVPYL